MLYKRRSAQIRPFPSSSILLSSSLYSSSNSLTLSSQVGTSRALSAMELVHAPIPENGIEQNLTRSEERRSPGASAPTNGKSGKQIGGPLLNSVNKTTSQIRKHPHRRSGSPLDWFPRKKSDSFLKRKIKLLQEIGGMTLSLDETLGGGNPHYSRIAREKIAAREAASKAMAARKAAMVEASWCRILKAARIQNKEADAELEKAEKYVSEAFEAAAAMGVMMYDRPDFPRRPYEIETLLGNGGGATHTITASFETAFEVDKEVAAAVKKAFIRLANCPSSSNKEEFRDLLHKISENPDNTETEHEDSETSSECESELCAANHTCTNETQRPDEELNKKMHMNQQLSKCSKTFRELVDMMFDRLKRLQEDELASLAIIVATCGLNAALLETESGKHHDSESGFSGTFDPSATISRRLSSMGLGSRRYSIRGLMEGRTKWKAATEVLSLDKYLVKHLSRLEREVLEARNSKKDSSIRDSDNASEASKTHIAECRLANPNNIASEFIPGLESILVKHVSRLERDIQEAKISEKNNRMLVNPKIIESPGMEVPGPGKANATVHGKEAEEGTEKSFEIQQKQSTNIHDKSIEEEQGQLDAGLDKAVPPSYSDGNEIDKENIDLDTKFTEEKCGGSTEVHQLHSQPTARKHLSRIERAKLEALEAFSVQDESGKNGMREHIGLDKIFVKSVHRLEREKMKALKQSRGPVPKGGLRKQGTDSATPAESLDRVLVKHVSRLEKEKLAALQATEQSAVSARKRGQQLENNGESLDSTTPAESLDKVLVKHVSRLEKEKLAALHTNEQSILPARKKDQQLEKDGESLDHILVKHQSRLEKAKLYAFQQTDDTIKYNSSHQEARKKELQAAWGGISLENSIKPHLSRLEREKAAWRKAEEEERRPAMDL